jgi:hypothetical protein
MAESTDDSQDEAQKEGTEHKDQRQMMSCSRAQGVRKRRFRLRPLLTQLPPCLSFSLLPITQLFSSWRERKEKKQKTEERGERGGAV